MTATDPAGNRLASTWVDAHGRRRQHRRGQRALRGLGPRRRRRRPLVARRDVRHRRPTTTPAAGHDGQRRRDPRPRRRASPVTPNTADQFSGTGTGYAGHADRAVAGPADLRRRGVVPDHLDRRRQDRRLRQPRTPAAAATTTGTSTSTRRAGSTSASTRRPADGHHAPGAYNDGQWHHVVASLSRGGHGALRRRRAGRPRAPTPRRRRPYNGYWRVGGDTPGPAPRLPRRRDRRGRRLPGRADRRPGASGTTPSAAALNLAADGGVHLGGGRPAVAVDGAGARPTSTARSAPTPGTSVTAPPAPGDRVAHLRGAGHLRRCG